MENCNCKEGEVCSNCYKPPSIYKYLIERIDTKEWYCLNHFGHFGYGYHGESFGVHPDKKNDWTNNANDAIQFDNKNLAEEFLKSNEFLHDRFNYECEVTEHEYVNSPT